MLNCGSILGADGGTVWASEPLQAVLYKGHSCIVASASKNPPEDLGKLLAVTLPFFSELCGTRFRTATLLKTYSLCMDLAYLEAVFRYSVALGAAKFPAGFHPSMGSVLPDDPAQNNDL